MSMRSRRPPAPRVQAAGVEDPGSSPVEAAHPARGGDHLAVSGAWNVAQLAARERPPPDVPVRERRPVIAVDGQSVRGARTRTGDDEGR
jgi:hypothetical protein